MACGKLNGMQQGSCNLPCYIFPASSLLLPRDSPPAAQPHARLPPQINLDMLRSVVEAAEALDGVSLRHVFTMEGGKWYG